MIQKNGLSRGIRQLFIAGLLSSVYATQSYALSWMNRDSYRVGNQGVGLDYFLSAHNANALGYGGIQFNINHFFNDPINFSYGAGYRRFVTPYMQAGIYGFIDSLSDSVVDAAFSNINIGFESIYYRWSGAVNFYLPNDARSPASSNLSTFYMEDNPRFGIDVKVGRLLFNQTTVKGGVYYFSHEKAELSTLGGSVHFSYPLTRRSTVDIKWVCDTSLENKWVISWQFNRSSPHDQTNSALWRPIDRPVSPLLLKRMQQRINQRMDSALSEKDAFTFTGKVLNQDRIEEIISKGYEAIAFKEACQIAGPRLNIQGLSLRGIPKKGSSPNGYRGELPVLTGQTLAMGGETPSNIKNLKIQLSPIGKHPIGLKINEGAKVSIESSKVGVEGFLTQNSSWFKGIQIEKGTSLILENTTISATNKSFSSNAQVHLFYMLSGANFDVRYNNSLSITSLSDKDKLTFFLPTRELPIENLCIAQTISPYLYFTQSQEKKQRDAIEARSGFSVKGTQGELRVIARPRNALNEISDLKRQLRNYSTYNPENLQKQYQDIQALLKQGAESLPKEIESLEKPVNSAYEKVYHECKRADLKKELPDSIEQFKSMDWFSWGVNRLRNRSQHIEADIAIIEQYLCAKANKEWVEETKEDLSEAYEVWEKFLKQEKTN